MSTVIARSVSDEAIHSIDTKLLDCFVAEFIIGPAEGGTRWLLAMTVLPAAPSVP